MIKRIIIISTCLVLVIVCGFVIYQIDVEDRQVLHGDSVWWDSGNPGVFNEISQNAPQNASQLIIEAGFLQGFRMEISFTADRRGFGSIMARHTVETQQIIYRTNDVVDAMISDGVIVASGTGFIAEGQYFPSIHFPITLECIQSERNGYLFDFLTNGICSDISNKIFRE